MCKLCSSIPSSDVIGILHRLDVNVTRINQCVHYMCVYNCIYSPVKCASDTRHTMARRLLSQEGSEASIDTISLSGFVKCWHT